MSQGSSCCSMILASLGAQVRVERTSLEALSVGCGNDGFCSPFHWYPFCQYQLCRSRPRSCVETEVVGVLRGVVGWVGR